MEYKIKVNLRADDILILVLIYIGLGVVFGLVSAFLFFIPIFSTVLMIGYFLIIFLITIKRILEMISIIPVENLNSTNKIKKDTEKEIKSKSINKSKQDVNTGNISDFEKYEKEFFETDSSIRKEELKEIMLNSREFLLKEKEYSSMDIESLEALSQAEDIFAIIEIYKRNK